MVARLPTLGGGQVTCGHCARPTRDNAYTCDDCLNTLANIIGSTPAYELELEHDLVGERSPRLESGSRSTEPPLPFNVKASELLAELRSDLVALVRLCWGEGVRHQSPDRELPADTIAAMSTWLLWRVDGMAWVEWSGEVARQWKALDRRIVKHLQPRAPKQYLGPCDMKCGGSVYAKQGESWGKCDRVDCQATYNREVRASNLQSELDSRLYPAHEIAKLSVYLGLNLGPKGREIVRRKVNDWARHGRIYSKGTDERGYPMYRYGEVKVLLDREFARTS